MIDNLNTILNQEKIQIIYDETNQNILFETYPSNSNSSQNQVFPLDSISAQIQAYHQKIDFLFENDERLPILHSRLKELEVIYKNECYLSTVVVIGSLLEALLKNELYKLKDDYYRLNKLPRDVKDNTVFKAC
ncbi:MAG: hypothetical protein KatS3mg035_0103 [Bacteroidia bacterium]|nr:MAG: hypothetical protein KatS3mg035_0103 [Bacteroidia bacterium]